MPKLIELVDLVTNFYTYEGVVKALNKVSLVVEHGSIMGLVGESGCGKSVTVRSMMRIIQEPGVIESGKILYFEDKENSKEPVDLLRQSEAFMRDLRGNQISMIFQEPNAALNPIMSIGDQVSESFLFHQKIEMCRQVLEDLNSSECNTFYPLRKFYRVLYQIAVRRPDAMVLKILSRLPVLKFWLKPLYKKAMESSVNIIKELGVANPGEVVKLYPHNLSGGMKQRIVIAIALACHPVLLIADEATSNLDVTIQAQILELLIELKKKEISSILLITHDLGVVAETCDRVGVMYAGNLCEVAGVEKLFRHPKHPYTIALLNSVPKRDQEGQLESIPGNVPNLVEPPAGCRFHPRCEHAMEICHETLPEICENEENHFVACHLFSKND